MGKVKDSINFDSHIPYYIQLMDILREKVQQAEWVPGDQIPGEQDLCEQYQVSRTVVRQALRELEFEGVISRQKGKGTFISLPKISEGLVQKLTGFYQDMVERGLKPGSQVLHQNVISSNDKIAHFLNIKSGEKVIDIQKTEKFILDLFFPKFCLGCQKEGTYLCDDCRTLLDISEYNYGDTLLISFARNAGDIEDTYTGDFVVGNVMLSYYSKFV